MTAGFSLALAGREPVAGALAGSAPACVLRTEVIKGRLPPEPSASFVVDFSYSAGQTFHGQNGQLHLHSGSIGSTTHPLGRPVASYQCIANQTVQDASSWFGHIDGPSQNFFKDTQKL